jgi:hypothetical protein
MPPALFCFSLHFLERISNFFPSWPWTMILLPLPSQIYLPPL